MPAPRTVLRASPVRETLAEEHQRLRRRTEELKEDHTALARDRRPFDQAEHDAHNADLATHKRDLAAHHIKTLPVRRAK
jgi:hypothetical protein